MSVLSRLVWTLLVAAPALAQPVPAFSKWTALNPAYLYGVAGDTNGNVYVASESSPGTINAEYYVAKVATDGSIAYQTQLKYIGALAAGDSGSVWVLGVGKVDARGNLTALPVNGEVIASDAAGRVYLAWSTAGGIAVSKLDTSGQVLATSNTGIQGSPRALAVDSTGAVYLTGEAFDSFAATPGAFQTTSFAIDPVRDPSGFAAKIAPGLDKVVYATLLGGTTGALCLAIAVDSAGAAIVGGSGQIDSGYANNVPFPLTHVGLPLLDPEEWDAYVLKLSADGSRLVYSLGLGYGLVGSLAVGVDGSAHAAGMIGEGPRGATALYTAGLFTIDARGSVLREQHLAPVPCCQTAAPWLGPNLPNVYNLAGVAAAPDGSPRLVTMIASQRVPPVYVEQPPAPYVIAAPASPPAADLSVTAASVQPFIGQPGITTTLDFRVTVTNAGPAAAEGVHIVTVPDQPYPLECIPGAGTICYQPGYAVINRLSAGERATVEFLYSYEEFASLTELTVPIEVFAATFDPNPANNEFTLTIPFVSGQSINFITDPDNLTFSRSDIPGKPICGLCPAADPHLTVWAPTPQTTGDGNTWYFDAWSDGVKDNPRVFDASRPLPALQIRFLPASPVSITPASLDFVAVAGAAPLKQSVWVGSLNPGEVFSIGAPADPWFSVSEALLGFNTYGGTSQLITGTVNTASLAPGYYTSSFPVTLTTNQATTQTIRVPVSLRITDQAPVIKAGGVVNAGSYAGGPISAREMISIFGSGLGPPQAAVATVPQAGSLPTLLGGTRVLVSGTDSAGVPIGPGPAELLFVQDGQISAILYSPDSPYFLRYQTALVQVEVGGIPGPTMSVAVTENAPGLFTSDASGRGNLAAVNGDGTINSPSHPARRGTYISLYATGITWAALGGFGLGNFGVDLLAPAAEIVEAFIGTEPADIQYAGVAPGLASAAQQINVLIPADSPTGPAVPVRVRVMNPYSAEFAWAWSQDGVTIAIQ